jgi:hypothetical protein
MLISTLRAGFEAAIGGRAWRIGHLEPNSWVTPLMLTRPWPMAEPKIEESAARKLQVRFDERDLEAGTLATEMAGQQVMIAPTSTAPDLDSSRSPPLSLASGFYWSRQGRVCLALLPPIDQSAGLWRPIDEPVLEFADPATSVLLLI